MQQYTREDLARVQQEETDFAALDEAMRLEEAVSGNPRFSGDSKLYVQFFSKPVKSLGKSEEAKRPIFVNRDFVKIMVPGDKHNIIVREASDEDKTRFATQFTAYRSYASQAVGTPLSQVPWLTEAQIEEMKFFNITTVEALAGVSDAVTQKFMGITDLKQKAQKYLDDADQAAGNAQGEQIKALQNQVAALLAAQEPTNEELARINDRPPQLPRAVKK